MSETNEQKWGRLEMMADPKQTQWDLSPNDQAAIRFALERNRLCEDIVETASALRHWRTDESIAPRDVLEDALDEALAALRAHQKGKKARKTG